MQTPQRNCERSEKNTKARRLQDLYSAVSSARDAWVLIYGNPDPDALASSWGLKRLMNNVGVDPDIGYTGEVGRLENQIMCDSLRIPAHRVDAAALAKADFVAIVDAQPEFFRGFPLPRCDMVIDHHPRKSHRSFAFADIRPNSLATSAIVTEYLRQAGPSIPGKLATALYYGIQTDRRNMFRKPPQADIDSIAYLENFVDRGVLRKIEYSMYSLARVDYLSVALIRMRHAHNVLYSHIGSAPGSDILAQIADFFIRFKELDWAMVSGVIGDKLVVVFRCDGYRKHAGKVAETAFGSLGSAGGHRCMARAEVGARELPEGLRLTHNENLQSFVLKAVSGVEKAFKPLYRHGVLREKEHLNL